MRRLFILASILSLILCAATVVLWVPSHRFSREVYWLRQEASGLRFTSASVMVSRGELWVGIRHWGDSNPPRHPEPPGLHYDIDVPWQFDVNGLGFGGGRFVAGPADHTDWAAAPLWLVLAVAAMPCAGWVAKWSRRWRLRSRTAGGLCRVCAYDLRASPDRCPECGTVPKNFRICGFAQKSHHVVADQRFL